MSDPDIERGVGNVKTEQLKLSLPDDGFRLEGGGVLDEINVAYESYGTLSPERDNVLFVCHALTGDAHVAGVNPEYPVETGWWDKMIGSGRGIDTDYYYVICANILGGCKGTTGPASINRATAKPYGSEFPDITVGDIVSVHRMLLQQLGINKQISVIGGSFGGMQALEWAIRFPEDVSHCVIIASAARLKAQALAFDVIGRRAITDDPNWQGGDYYGTGLFPAQGLSQARKLAHVTYLSQELMCRKFGRERREDWLNAPSDVSEEARRKFRTSFQVESYLNYQGEKFTRRFDANSYLHITSAMDEFDLCERFGSLENAVAGIRAKVLITGLSGDWLFLPEQAMEIAVALQSQEKQVSFCRLDSPHGHDAFLTQVDYLSELVRSFLPWVGRKRTPAVSGEKSDSLKRRSNDSLLSMLEPESRTVIDLGCGDGELLFRLQNDGRHVVGVDLDLEHVIHVIEQGGNILLDDIERGLKAISDNTYDCAILNDSLQVVSHPREVLREVLRVSKKAVVAFPNFGYCSLRTQLFVHGKMPKRGNLPFEWYNTPNIHLFTLSDFMDLCREDEINVEKAELLAEHLPGKLLLKLGRPNLGAERVVVRISKKGCCHV